MPIVQTHFSYEAQSEKLDRKAPFVPLKIGIPKETAFQETRISLTPEAVNILTHQGHTIVVEHHAGKACNYSDEAYSKAGAQIEYESQKVYKMPILLKTAPLVAENLPHLGMGQTIVSPLHFPALEKATIEKMMERKMTALSYEKLKDETGQYPIVRSMSEITGGALLFIAAQYLGSFAQGSGVLLGSVTGVPSAEVVVIGAGFVGELVCRNALALGMNVKVFDNNLFRLQQLKKHIGQQVWTSILSPQVLTQQLKTCDVAIGCLVHPSGKSSLVVTEEMVAQMRAGSVIIDAAIDRGGCFETSRLTNHLNPVFTQYEVVHYAVPNIASRFAHTASQAISNALLHLLLEMGEAGSFEKMAFQKRFIRDGFYLLNGILTDKNIGEKLQLKHTDTQLFFTSKS